MIGYKKIIFMTYLESGFLRTNKKPKSSLYYSRIINKSISFYLNRQLAPLLNKQESNVSSNNGLPFELILFIFLMTKSKNIKISNFFKKDYINNSVNIFVKGYAFHFKPYFSYLRQLAIIKKIQLIVFTAINSKSYHFKSKIVGKFKNKTFGPYSTSNSLYESASFLIKNGDVVIKPLPFSHLKRFNILLNKYLKKDIGEFILRFGFFYPYSFKSFNYLRLIKFPVHAKEIY